MECNTNKDFCRHSICKLSFKSRRIKQLTWTCDLTKKVDMVNVQVTLFYRYRAGYKQFLIDVNVDHCAYHRNQIGSALIELVHEVLKNHTSNIWHPCPFLPGNVSITNLPLTPSLVKNLFVPAGDYKLTLNTKVNSENGFVSLLLMKIFINVPAGRTLEDDNMG